MIRTAGAKKEVTAREEAAAREVVMRGSQCGISWSIGSSACIGLVPFQLGAEHEQVGQRGDDVIGTRGAA